MGAMDWTDHTTRRTFEGAARNYHFYGGLIWFFCHKSIESLILHYWLEHFLPTISILLLVCWWLVIFPERFVTKKSYQPSIKMIVSCCAFKTASSSMVRSVHGTHPLTCQSFLSNTKGQLFTNFRSKNSLFWFVLTLCWPFKIVLNEHWL